MEEEIYTSSFAPRDCSTISTITGTCDGKSRTTSYLTSAAANGGAACSQPTAVVESCANCLTTSSSVGACAGGSRTINYLTASAVNGGSSCTSPTAVVESCDLCSSASLGSGDCGVVNCLYSKWGLPTSSSSATSCCSLEGITCEGGSVTEM